MCVYTLKFENKIVPISLIFYNVVAMIYHATSDNTELLLNLCL